MWEQLRKGHEHVPGVAAHGQIWPEIAHGIPLLHLQQREGPLNVLLRVNVLPT